MAIADSGDVAYKCLMNIAKSVLDSDKYFYTTGVKFTADTNDIFPCFQKRILKSKKYRRCYSMKIINIGYLFYICRNQSDHPVRYIMKPRTTTMAKESQFVVFFFS